MSLYTDAQAAIADIQDNSAIIPKRHRKADKKVLDYIADEVKKQDEVLPFPSVRPVELINIQNSGLGSTLINNTRASGANVINRLGLLQAVGNNELRIDYSYGQPMALVERALFNTLQPNANNFSSGLYQRISITASQNQTGPDGLSNSAWTLAEVNGGAGPRILFETRFTANVRRYFSCFIKRRDRKYVLISFSSVVPTARALFDFDAEAFVPITGSVSSNSLHLTSYVQKFQDGWYRIITSHALPANDNVGFVNISTAVNSPVSTDVTGVFLPSDTGDSTKGLIVANMQWGDFPVSYFNGTRQADNPIISGTNLARIYSPNVGTLIVGARANLQQQTDATLFSINDGTNNNMLRIVLRPNGRVGLEYRRLGNVIYNADVGTNTHTAHGEYIQVGIAWSGLGLYVYERKGGEYLSGTEPSRSMTQIQLGNHLGTDYLNSGITEIIPYATRLSVNELKLVMGNGRWGDNPNQVNIAGLLGSTAFMSLESLLALPKRQEYTESGTGASKTVVIRRPYLFNFVIVESTGVTITAQPLATCEANTDYNLTFTASTSTLLVYSITPIL